MSSLVFASTGGGLLSSAFVSDLGIPGIFVVPAVLSAASLVGMGVLARRLGRRREVPAEVVEVARTAGEVWLVPRCRDPVALRDPQARTSRRSPRSRYAR